MTVNQVNFQNKTPCMDLVLLDYITVPVVLDRSQEQVKEYLTTMARGSYCTR